MSCYIPLKIRQQVKAGDRVIKSGDLTFIGFCLAMGCCLTRFTVRGKGMVAELYGRDWPHILSVYDAVLNLFNLTSFGCHFGDIYDVHYRVNQRMNQSDAERTAYACDYLSDHFCSYSSKQEDGHD